MLLSDVISFAASNRTVTLTNDILDYLESQEDHPGTKLARLLGLVRSEEEDENLGPNAANSIKNVGKAVGARVVAGFVAKYAKKLVKLAWTFTRGVVLTAGRILVRYALMPVLRVLAWALLTPPGLVATGILTGVGLGYFIYRKFFQKEDPSIRIDEKEFSANRQAIRAGASPDELFEEMPSYFEPTGSKGQGAGEVGVTEDIGPRTPIKTATEIQTAEAAQVSPDKLAQGRRILQKHRSERVKNAIKEASRRTGISEAILNAFAYKESTFREVASPGTSSAQGLFQFIDRTWRSVVDRYGKRYGVPSNASRNDPLASSIMAAAYLKHDIYPQISKVVSNPTATDLYFGHFMGPAGGRNFLKNLHSNPNRYAYLDFVKEAGSNGWVYFHGYRNMNGGRAENAHDIARRFRPKTYREIYNAIAGQLQMIQAAVEEETMVAANDSVGTHASIVSEPTQSPVTTSQNANSLNTNHKYDRTASNTQYMKQSGTNLIVAVS